jgi:hypothetical protein
MGGACDSEARRERDDSDCFRREGYRYRDPVAVFLEAEQRLYGIARI